MAKIGTNKTVGQPKSGTMRVANATSSGFGIIYADEIIGHRRVDTFEDLKAIPNWALYDQAGGAEISTAKGQLWYVSDQSKMYQLTEIDATGANRTWTEFKGTDSSYSLPVMTNTVLGGAKLVSNTTQTTDVKPVTTTINRTYAVQKNLKDQLVVNVPWVDTKYTFTSGTDGSFSVTPSDGTPQKVTTGKPANAGHADTATSAEKATKDSENNVIVSTYATKSEISALTSALVYKGTVNGSSDLPTTNVKVGDVYIVAKAGMYAGQLCENGDMIIAKVGGNTPEWTVVQTNIDGAITIKPNEKLTKDCIVVGASDDIDTSVIGLAPSTGYLYWDGKKYVWKTPAEFNLKPATADALGGIKIGFASTNDRQYAVQLDDNNKAFVNVPWTDTNTTYTAGSGINISGNTIGWDDATASNLADVFSSGFKGYLTKVSKTTTANGISTLYYSTGGAHANDVDIIKIYDTTTGAEEGLASIKAVRSATSTLQNSIQTVEDNLHEQINNVGSALNNKVNTADKITEADINALFTNN